MNETVLLIMSASLSPSPATINSKVTLSVTTIEIQNTPHEETRYSGEFYAGEV